MSGTAHLMSHRRHAFLSHTCMHSVVSGSVFRTLRPASRQKTWKGLTVRLSNGEEAAQSQSVSSWGGRQDHCR